RWCGDIVLQSEIACENAKHVSVEHGRAFSEGDRGDGCRRVVANPGEPSQFFKSFWKDAPVFLDDHPCTANEVSRARVISEALPVAEHFFLGCRSQRIHGWIVGREAIVVGSSRSEERRGGGTRRSRL